MNYENFTQEDWNKLNGWNWKCLLIHQPQLSEFCDWSKLRGRDWRKLLIYQPQLYEFCDWSKLDGYDWRKLLQQQPQFNEFHEYCVKYQSVKHQSMSFIKTVVIIGIMYLSAAALILFLWRTL